MKKGTTSQRDCAERISVGMAAAAAFSSFERIKNDLPYTRLFPGKRLEIERVFPARAALPSADTAYRAAAIRPTPAG